MTRVTSRSTVCSRKSTRSDYHGNIDRTYVDDTVGCVTQTLTRSDITINPAEVDGWRKPSPYIATLTASDPGQIHAVVDYTNNRELYIESGKVGAWNSGPYFTVTESALKERFPTSSDVDASVILARNNVADRVASFGESLAELVQTLKSLAGLAGSIDSFIQAAMAKDYKRVADSLGIPRNARKHRRAVVRFNGMGIPTVANAFLCWNFGLSPIIEDMVALAVLMGSGKPLRITGKSLYRPRGWKQQRSVTYTSQVPPTAFSYDINFIRKSEVGVATRLDYEVSLEALRNLTSYGLLDAPATLWALVPYSFLVDFVLPVSEVLRSMTATFGLSYKGGSATRFSKIDDKFVNSKPDPDRPGMKCREFRLSVGDLHGVHMERIVFKTDPEPATLWIKDPISAFSAATVFSLLAQSLEGKTNRHQYK